MHGGLELHQYVFDAAFWCVLRGGRHFMPTVVTQEASELQCLGAAGVMFSQNTISQLCSWKSHIEPHSGNCISSVISNELHFLSIKGWSSVSEPKHVWSDLLGLSGGCHRLEWSQLVLARQQPAPPCSVQLLCFSIDVEREGMGVSASGGCYRAFNSHSVNYAALKLYLFEVAGLHWRLLSGVLCNGLLFQWSIK